MKKNTQQRGAATLIFLLIMALFVSLLAALTYSRLLVSLKRSLAESDAVITNYSAESQINDILSKLKNGYLNGNFNTIYTKNVDGTDLKIEQTQVGNTQTIVVTGDRSYAVSRIEATRKIDSIGNVNNVDILLSLDCTGSMDAGANCDNCNSTPTRFDAQKDAAISFIDRLISINNDPKYSGKFNLGVQVFGVDSKWLTLAGRPVTPGAFQLDQIKTAINSGFGSTRATSPACNSIMDATSIGTAYTSSHEYFAQNKRDKTKQVEVVITDGEPNSRIPYGACSPSVFCPAFPKTESGQNLCDSNQYGWSCYQGSSYKDGPYDSDGFNQAAYNTCEPLGLDFLSCSIADTNTSIPPIPQSASIRKGSRDPDVSAYGVTIFTNPPRDVVNSFTTYLSENGYFNATRASQLRNILNTVLNEILRDRSTITIKRTPPTP